MPSPKSDKVKIKTRRPTLPAPPYLDEARVVTANGLRAIELLAANGAPQSKIAAVLGLGLTNFKKRLAANNQSSAERMSWERGRGELEYEVSLLLLDQARNGNAISAIFYGKSQLNWVDTPQPTQQVGIQIVVPDSLTREQWAASLPQVTVVEQKEIAPPVETVSQDATPEPEEFIPAGYVEP